MSADTEDGDYNPDDGEVEQRPCDRSPPAKKAADPVPFRCDVCGTQLKDSRPNTVLQHKQGSKCKPRAGANIVSLFSKVRLCCTCVFAVAVRA
jgi:hypothetical protein